MRSLHQYGSYIMRRCTNNGKLIRIRNAKYHSKCKLFSQRGIKSNQNNILHKRSSIYFSNEASSSDPKLPFIITDASCNRLNFLKTKRNEKDLMLRIGVSAGGCSGFQYEFEFANPSDIEEDEDIILTKENAQFVVDKTSLKFIKGAKLDFVSDFIQTSFVLTDNPNIVSECGCNVSFAPNPDLLEDDDDDEK